MKQKANLIILILLVSVIVSAVVFTVGVNVPSKWFDVGSIFQKTKLGSVVTTISSTDKLSDFPAVYNADMAEISAELNSVVGTTTNTTITTLSGLTSATSLASVGTITSGTWSATTIGASKGGTGSTTLSAFHVLLGSTTNPIGIVAGVGTDGQYLVSQGANLPPVWETVAIDTTLSYDWSGSYFGVKNLWASSTAENPIYLNGIDYAFPTTENSASSTIWVSDGAGKLSWSEQGWQLISTSTAISNQFATSTLFASNYTDIRVYLWVASTTANTLEMWFNGTRGSKYGSKYILDNEDGYYTSNSTELAVDASTSSERYFVFDIYNVANQRKHISWTGEISGIPALAPITNTGSGVYNEATDGIREITFRLNAQNMPASTIIRVYGRK